MKQWLDAIRDPNRDIYDRRYRLLTGITIVMLLSWRVLSGIVSPEQMKLRFFFLSTVISVLTYLLALRYDKTRLAACLTSAYVTLVLVPFAFLYNGGVAAGAPCWCLMALIFTITTVRGRLKWVLSVLAPVVTGIMYVVTYRNPELVQTRDTLITYLDSVGSVLLTSVMAISMLVFQMYVSYQERTILEAQRSELEEMNRSQSSFFSAMSHEIRTPINTIIGMNEVVLRDRTLSPETVQRLLSIGSASQMLLALINDVLDMSKMESGKMDIVGVEYDLAMLLGEVAGMVRGKATEKGLAFYVRVDETLPVRLFGDEVRIKQVLINLLSNAVKYTAQGSVTMSVLGERTDAEQILLTFRIEDTGMGIRKEAIPHLFDAFKRVDEEKNRNIEGTGLGLSIVKQIMDIMGGEISVSSVYTKGSTFTVSLSQDIVDNTHIGRFDSRLAAGTERTGYKQSFEAAGAKLLIVDDNEMNLTVEKSLLSDTKIAIDTATSGKEALELTLQTRYDVIFMDHLMPEMDGIECLKRIREQAGGLCRDAQVLALTANAGSENQALYAASGFDGYLLKPVSGAQLEAALLKALPESKVSLTGSATIQAGSNTVFSQLGKKKAVAITMDSGCDLPKMWTERMEIAVINYLIHTEQGVFRDNVEIDSDELMRHMEDPAKAATSKAPSVAQFENFFGARMANAQHVIHIAIASGVSNGYANAKEAAKAFDNVTVIDSGALSSAAGMLALYAAHLARAGDSVEEVLKKIRLATPLFHTSFVLENADFLVRSGRIKNTLQKLLDAFLLHPVIELRRSEMRARFTVFSAYRKSYIQQILNRYRKTDFDTSLLIISYVGLTERELAEIREEARRVVRFERVVFQKASAAIAVSCGPGTVGLMFRLKGNDRDTGRNLFDFLPDENLLRGAVETREEQQDEAEDTVLPEPQKAQEMREQAIPENTDSGLPDSGERREAEDAPPLLDEETAILHCGTREVFESALKLFAESAYEKADEIETYLNNEDWENYTIKVHALKSSARLIGATALSEFAKELEALGNAAKQQET